MNPKQDNGKIKLRETIFFNIKEFHQFIQHKSSQKILDNNDWPQQLSQREKVNKESVGDRSAHGNNHLHAAPDASPCI